MECLDVDFLVLEVKIEMTSNNYSTPKGTHNVTKREELSLMDVYIDQKNNEEERHESQRDYSVNEPNVFNIILEVDESSSNNDRHNQDDDSLRVDLFSGFIDVEHTLHEHGQ